MLGMFFEIHRVNNVGLLSFSIILGAQIMYSILLIAESNDAATITLSSIIAFTTLLNSIGVFGLLFKIGKYIGTTDARLQSLETKATGNTAEAKATSDVLMKHGESLARLETEVSSMVQDVRVVKARQHDLANIIMRVTMQPVELRQIIDKEG